MLSPPSLAGVVEALHSPYTEYGPNDPVPIVEVDQFFARETNTVTTCGFCGSVHDYSKFPTLPNRYPCVVVRWIETQWGQDNFRYSVDPYGPFWFNTGDAREPVFRFEGELPVIAWLRFERHMWANRFDCLDNKPSYLIGYEANLFNVMGPRDFDYARVLLKKGESSYNDVARRTLGEQKRMATTLLLAGWNITHRTHRVLHPTVGQGKHPKHRYDDCPVRPTPTWQVDNRVGPSFGGPSRRQGKNQGGRLGRRTGGTGGW